MRVGEPVHVHSGESHRSVVVIQSSVTIDGNVDEGRPVVVGGNARINGTVGGNVVNVGGGIQLGPGARIDGDTVRVLGGIRMAENSGHQWKYHRNCRRGSTRRWRHGERGDHRQSFPFPPFGGVENGTSALNGLRRPSDG